MKYKVTATYEDETQAVRYEVADNSMLALHAALVELKDPDKEIRLAVTEEVEE